MPVAIIMMADHEIRDGPERGAGAAVTDGAHAQAVPPERAAFERRPWGSFTVLDQGHGYKVKRIEVAPGHRLSYQKHARRAEHWTVVAGTARVTLDGLVRDVRIGEAVDVPIGAAHRVENPGQAPLVFVEVQLGDYLGEDDIVRLQDDYGR